MSSSAISVTSRRRRDAWQPLNSGGIDDGRRHHCLAGQKLVSSLSLMSRSTLEIWSRLKGHAVGRWLFSRAICFKAPYFATIRPRIHRLEPGCCELRFNKRRLVTNHIGTVHAIAMCNAAELAAGLATEVTAPPSFRWIPKGMTVSYLKPARTSVAARAQCALIDNPTDTSTLQVSVDIRDLSDTLVFHAVVEMHISRRKADEHSGSDQ